MDETASDWEQNFASLQDFFGELVVYAEVCSFQLPAATLHLLFLLEVSEFGHNRTRPRGSRFLRSHPMDSFEADVFHGVFRKLQVCLDKVFNRSFSRFKVQGSCLFVTYTIIQGIISSEMEVRTGPLNGQCKKNKNKR